MTPSRSKVDRVAEALESAIRSGVYAPGEKLPPLRKLAGTFGVSTMVLHQAGARLEKAGLLTRSPRTGFFIPEKRYQRELCGMITSVSPAADAAYYTRLLSESGKADKTPMVVGNRIEDIDAMLEKKPGKVYLDLQIADMTFREIADLTRGVETIFCNRFEWGHEAPESAVLSDWEYITTETLRRFLKHGHKRILFVSHNDIIYEHKLRDFRAAAEKLGIAFETPEFQWCCARDFEKNPERVKRIFRKDAPTAVFARGDLPLYRFMHNVATFYPDRSDAELVGAFDTEWAKIPGREFPSWRWDWGKFWGKVFSHKSGVAFYRPALCERTADPAMKKGMGK
ncbi:MAG: GntR family transcriptional regulator [Victivallaceae bacterium]|nr:GntR family transcriptional regulator [Victivallaceae bacterium]